VVAGGKSDREAHYLDPTLLYPITWDDKIMEDEIFGPILPILTYKSSTRRWQGWRRTAASACRFIFSREQKTIDRFIGNYPYGWRRRESGEVFICSSRRCRSEVPGPPGWATTTGKYASMRSPIAKSMLISRQTCRSITSTPPSPTKRTGRFKAGLSIETKVLTQHTERAEKENFMNGVTREGKSRWPWCA